MNPSKSDKSSAILQVGIYLTLLGGLAKIGGISAITVQSVFLLLLFVSFSLVLLSDRIRLYPKKLFNRRSRPQC